MLHIFYRKSSRNEDLDPDNYEYVCTLDTDERDVAFREMNVVEGWEVPVTLRMRSMSVGDVTIKMDGVAKICSSVGWSPVPDAFAGALFDRAPLGMRQLKFKLRDKAPGYDGDSCEGSFDPDRNA